MSSSSDDSSSYATSLVSTDDRSSESGSSSSSSASSNSFSSSFEAPTVPDGNVHRSPLLGEDDELMRRPPSLPNVRTTNDAFLQAVQRFPNHPFLGKRVLISADDAEVPEYGDYEFDTYTQVYNKCEALAGALLARDAGDVVGLYLSNCPAWAIVQLSANLAGKAVGGMYDTLGEAALAHCINLCEINTVFCSADKLKTLLNERVTDDAPGLETVVCVDTEISSLPKAVRKLARKGDVQLIAYDEYVAPHANRAGRKTKKRKKKTAPALPKVKASHLNTICFTSGTTGVPKAVMLTHGNLVADVAGGMAGGLELIPGEDAHLSWLPMAHMFERMVQLGVTMYGGRIGFYSGDVRARLMSDVQTLRPTIFPAVPRILTRIYDKVLAGVENKGALSRFLFHRAYNTKQKNIQGGSCCHGQSNHHWLWDRLVFKKARNHLGGRVRILITGSAPISPEVMTFLRIAFCCTVLEGYGQSENTAAATVTHPDDLSTGHVGYPLPCGEIALSSIPEMGYIADGAPMPKKKKKKGKKGKKGKKSSDDEFVRGGEICLRGPHVMRGYYGNPRKTAETIDAEGWLHTGDIGVWTDDGALKIVGRKRATVKLQNGEFVALAKVEGVMTLAPLVGQCWVYCDSLKPVAVAVVVVDKDAGSDWAQDNGTSWRKLVKKGAHNNKALTKAVLDQMNEMGRAIGDQGRARLLGFEIPKAVHIVATSSGGGFEEWDLLTPTSKLRRKQLYEHFEDEVEAMYEALS